MPFRVALIFLLSQIFISQVFAEAPLSKKDIARLHVKRWELVEARLGAEYTISAADLCGGKSAPSIDFRANGDFRGGDCCNSITGKYSINASSRELHIPEASFTALACLPESKIDTSTFLEMLKNNTIELDGAELKLSATTGDRVLIYRAVE
jgi:heat shock protein HslJ